jgi:hypothetical protein
MPTSSLLDCHKALVPLFLILARFPLKCVNLKGIFVEIGVSSGYKQTLQREVDRRTRAPTEKYRQIPSPHRLCVPSVTVLARPRISSIAKMGFSVFSCVAISRGLRCRLRFQADSSDHIGKPVIVSQRIKNRFHLETYEAGFPIAERFFQRLQRTLVVTQPNPND